jgi:hypothetical protein
MGNTKSKFEKIAGKRATKKTGPANDAHYQSTVALLQAWDGDADALLAELGHRSRARKMPALPALDMSNKFDDGVLFVEMVNRVAERLSVGIVVPASASSSDVKSELRQQSEPARKPRERLK